MLNRTLLLLVAATAGSALFLFGTSSFVTASEKVSLLHVDKNVENAIILSQGTTGKSPTLGSRFMQTINRIWTGDDTGNTHNHNISAPVAPPATPIAPPKPITSADMRQAQSSAVPSQVQRPTTGVANSVTQRQNVDTMPPSYGDNLTESDDESIYARLAQLRRPVFSAQLEEAAQVSRQFPNTSRAATPPINYDDVRNSPDHMKGQPNAAGRSNDFSELPTPAMNPPSASIGSRDIVMRETGTRQPMPRTNTGTNTDPLFSRSSSQDTAQRITAAGTMETEQLRMPEMRRIVSANPVLKVEIEQPESASINQEIACQVRVTNIGNAPAEQVVVTIGIPAWINVRDKDTTNGDCKQLDRENGSGATDLEWTISHVDQDTTETLVLQVVSQLPRPIELAVKHTFSPPAIIAKVEVREPKLKMELLGADEVLWNDTVIYTLLVQNIGNGNAENLKLELLQTNSAGAKTCELPTLRPGDDREISIELMAGREQEYIDIAVSATGSHNLKGDAKRRIRVLRPQLDLRVQTLPKHLVDNPAEIVIRVRNAGTADAENINITAALPLGVQYESSNEGGIFSAQQNAIQWRRKTIAIGEMQTFTLICLPKREGDCRISVEISENGSSEPLKVDNTAFVSEAVTELELGVLKPNGPIELGQEAEYTIQLTNVGTKTAENVEVLMAFGWKMGVNEPVTVLEPMQIIGDYPADYDKEKGLVVFKAISQIQPKQTVTLKVITQAIETGAVQIRTDVNGKNINLTNGLTATVINRRTGAAAGSSKQDEVFR